MKNIAATSSFALMLISSSAIGADEKSPFKSSLKDAKTDTAIFTDVNGDGKPDILETWWNGKRCRWFDENGDMRKTDRRGDMVGDSLQVDIDGDGFYDGPSDMNLNWVDKDGDGQADLMCFSENPGAKQKELWGGSSHYMYFIDVDGDGVNHHINWEKFSFDAWRHTGGCNFSPDYNGDSIFIKTHLPPWALSDARFNWENPFAFYDFDDDGCTEMAVRYLNHHTKKDDVHTYSGLAGTVQIGFDLDNDSQRGQEQGFDMSLGFDGPGVDYRKQVNEFPGQKAPAWVLPYFQHKNYREIDELIFMPHELCFAEAMKGKWDKARFIFDEDNDDHRWERVEFYEPGDPYLPRPAKGEKNNSVVRNTQTDTLGDRAEWDADFSGKGQLYIGPWDNKLHLHGAESGVWLVDDGSFFGSGSAPRATSPAVAPKVREVVQYTDTDNDGFLDRITYDYDGDKTVDLEVSLREYGIKAPALIDPETEKWQGLHGTFKTMAKQSWADAQKLYRAAWRAGLTDPELDELAIASSNWEKYDHGYWLKEKLFRKLYKKSETDTEKQKALKRAYFTRDFDAMAALMAAGFKSILSARAEDPANTSNPIAQVKYIPQRKDDIAWENGRIAHRIYGPALEVTEPTGSGIDVWVKSVRYPVIDKWYKGDNYHKDHGEGLDFYGVGKSRGCGGLGVWDGKVLSVSGHWKSYEIKETGGDRAVFVVKYGPWKLPDGHEVSESRTITLEEGGNLTRMESVFTSDLPELTIGIGITKRATGKKTAGEFFKNPGKGVMAYWQSENTDHGHIGLGVVIDPKQIAGFAEDKLNHLLLVKVKPGEPLVYHSGACWSKGMDFHTFDEWKVYLEKESGAK